MSKLPISTSKWSFLNENDKKIIRYTAYGLGIGVLGGGIYALGRWINRNIKRTKEEEESFKDNTDANFAKRFKLGFDNGGWWGTDVDIVRRAFIDLPSQEMFDKAATSYNLQFGTKLRSDLESELTNSELQEMMAILQTKPSKKGVVVKFDYEQAKRFAKRFKAAFEYTILGMPSTDKQAVKQVLIDIKSKYQFDVVNVAYKNLYGEYLVYALDKELDVFDFKWRDMLKSKPNN
jgi:hypothetical protein